MVFMFRVGFASFSPSKIPFVVFPFAFFSSPKQRNNRRIHSFISISIFFVRSDQTKKAIPEAVDHYEK